MYSCQTVLIACLFNFALYSDAGCNADIHVIVKIESADSIPNLPSIISACDGVSFFHTLRQFICSYLCMIKCVAYIDISLISKFPLCMIRPLFLF